MSGVLAWSRTVPAQAIRGVEVRWVAPPTCPGAEEVLARLRRLVGPEAIAPHGKRLVADGTVAWVGGRYRLSLQVRREGSAGVTRVFDSDSCGSLAGAAAVTLALLVRAEPRSDDAAVSTPPSHSSSSAPSSVPAAPSSSAGTSGGPPSPPPSASPPPTAVAPATASPPPDTHPLPPAPPHAAHEPPSGTAPRGAESRWSVVLGGPLLAADEGILPSWAFGAGVSAGVRVNRFEALLTAILWLPQNDGATSTSFYGGRYTRRSGELSSCYDWPWGRFAIAPCLTVTLENVSAQGTGPGVVRGPGGILWTTVGLGARAGWSPRPWTAVFVRPGLVFSTSRPKFAIDQVGSVYQVPLVAIGVDVGCEWIL